jgi:hypothetical protein
VDRPAGGRPKKRVRARRLITELVALGAGSIEYFLQLPQDEILTWYIAFGERRGGKWDYDKQQWSKPPGPPAVLAVPATMG